MTDIPEIEKTIADRREVIAPTIKAAFKRSLVMKFAEVIAGWEPQAEFEMTIKGFVRGEPGKDFRVIMHVTQATKLSSSTVFMPKATGIS